jgi:hypothetical protein
MSSSAKVDGTKLIDEAAFQRLCKQLKLQKPLLDGSTLYIDVDGNEARRSRYSKSLVWINLTSGVPFYDVDFSRLEDWINKNLFHPTEVYEETGLSKPSDMYNACLTMSRLEGLGCEQGKDFDLAFNGDIPVVTQIIEENNMETVFDG